MHFTPAKLTGEVKNQVCHRVAMTHVLLDNLAKTKASITVVLIHMSVGIEHVDYLISDIARVWSEVLRL